MPEMGYDAIRGYMKKERKDPSVYMHNRVEALVTRAKIEGGEGMQQEIINEFAVNRRVGKYSRGVDFDKDGKIVGR